MSTGDFPRNEIEKSGYTIVFQDDFEDDDLNLVNWLPYYLPQWSSRANSKAKYRIENSLLVLQITEDQLPWSQEFNGDVKVSNLQTGVYSGPVGSPYGQHKFSSNCLVREEQTLERLFTPQYGYFEIRAKGIRNPNNVCAFWMIGFEDQPHKSAEICPFELKGWNVGSGTCTLGFGLHPFGDPEIHEEFFEKEFQLDPTQFHLYAVDWTEQGVDFYIDNELIYTSRQSPRYPMQLMLNIYEVPPHDNASKVTPVYPSEFSIDYVRCYQKNC